VPKLKANLTVALSTREERSHEPQLLAEAHCTYAGQPIIGQMVSGAILALRDRTHPWPIDLRIDTAGDSIAQMAANGNGEIAVG
jgi:AsmA family protein